MGIVTVLGATILACSAVVLLMAYFGMRAWMAVLGVACIVGGAMGWQAVSVAIWFNRQGEFVNDVTGAVNYLGLAEIFLSLFLVVSFLLGVGLMIVVWAVRWLRILLVR
jgi:hypothetical protein